MGIKKRFAAYLPLTDASKSGILEKGVVAFDTNVLLGFYRYAPITRREVADLIQKRIAGRAWIPHQVAVEFLRNRTQYINEDQARVRSTEDQLSKAFDNLIVAINKAEFEKIGAKLDLQTILGTLEASKAKLLEELRAVASGYPNLAANDEVLEFVESLFGDNIGPPFASQAELDAIYQEGQKRYELGIPPGYKDTQKDESAYVDGGLHYRRKFGDLVIWKQLLKQVTQQQDRFRRLVFVTQERKEDWWIVEHGRTIGPRVELRQELEQAGVQEFHMYSISQFIEMLRKQSPQEKAPLVSDKSLEEVKSAEAEANYVNLGELLRGSSRYGALGNDDALVSWWDPFIKPATHGDGYQGFASQAAVRTWLILRHPQAEIIENETFPDLMVRTKTETSPQELAILGYEVITPKNPGHLKALLRSNIARAEAFLRHMSVVPDVTLTFVITLHAAAIRNTPIEQWIDIVSLQKIELSAKTQLDIVLGVLDRDTFKEVELPV
jgi:hypothetical protein